MAMASAYHAAGRFEEAERNVVEAIALIEKLEGDNESRLATAHNNLGEILRERGELDRARGELEIGQALYEKIYGADHPRHALSLNNLANIDLETNELVRAEQRFRQVIEIREHALGPDHPHLAMALSNLGLALRRQGRLDEAKQAVERALAVMRSRGPDDMRTAGVLMGLGRIAEEQGDFRAALRHFDHALALEEAGLPPEHPDIARSLYSRAIVLVHLGDLTAARSSLDRADAIKAAINGGDVWVAEGRFAFARALHEHGELAEARKVAAQVLAELAPGSAPELQAEVEAWLADRGARYP
jgi:tetratricopeptide (TPR) repeat protein